MPDSVTRPDSAEAALSECEERYGKAQEAIRERELLLSVASHELKTPLASLLGYARLLQSRACGGKPFGDRDQRGLAAIIDQGERLNRMLDLLLDFSRIESGRLTIDRRPVDLRSLVLRVVEEVRPVTEDHTIIFEQPEVPIVIAGDEMRLEQVVRNLLANAIKYSPAGGPINLRLEQCDRQICLSIRDLGLGISQEQLPHIFQRFYRASNVGSPTIGGLGIGLYVVNEIIGRHGGRIAVTSVEGEGSTFTVCLPAG